MTADDVGSWLEGFIERHGGVAGTVHVVGDAGVLEMAASHNIPPKVVEITRAIPKGKGMAGLAWERDAPVQTCNLKDDRTGDVRPGAKAVDATAAVALPVSAGGTFVGVVGIAYADDRELSEEQLATLAADADGFPR